jgi:HNH endonuclease
MLESMPWPLSWELVARFWSNVDVGGRDACWEWQRSRGTSAGHGRIRFSPGYETSAQRVAWALAHGRPPAEHVLHHCDNPPCCNPAHLYEGTQVDNSRDAVERGRTTRGRVRPESELHRGEGHPMVKLTEDDVREIRRLAAEGVPRAALARRHAISGANIGLIVSGKTWRHVV